VAGFTLIEALVALAIMAFSLGAIAELAVYTHRSGLSIENRLAAVETAQKIIAGLPDRGKIGPTGMKGEMGNQRWRVESRFYPVDFGNLEAASVWSLEEILVEVQGPTGAQIRINMVRLIKSAAR
jgi:general secretion pathway protein I